MKKNEQPGRDFDVAKRGLKAKEYYDMLMKKLKDKKDEDTEV